MPSPPAPTKSRSLSRRVSPTTAAT
jgi:hypothetical protein